MNDNKKVNNFAIQGIVPYGFRDWATKKGKKYVNFLLKTEVIYADKTYNRYYPITIWNEKLIELVLKVNTQVEVIVKGELHLEFFGGQKTKIKSRVCLNGTDIDIKKDLNIPFIQVSDKYQTPQEPKEQEEDIEKLVENYTKNKSKPTKVDDIDDEDLPF